MYELVNANKKLREVSQKEYKTIIQAKSYILFYLQFEELFELVKANFHDFWNYIFEICEIQRLNFITDFSELIDPILFSNQKLANILSSFQTYIDHLKHSISNNFCKNSEEYQTCETIFCEVYDLSFSYRIMSRLRNYIQHFGLPITQITYDSKLINREPIEWIQFVNLMLDRNMLLKYKKWSTVKKEIEELDEYFDIKPFVNNYYNNLNNIHSKMRYILKKKYDESKSLLKNIIKEEFSEQERLRFWSIINPSIFIYQIKGDEIINKVYIPYNVIKRIDKLLKRNICSHKKGISYSIIK